MCCGASRSAATEFSFFLAIPVMLGASSLKLWKHREHLDDQVGPILIGFSVAFVVALVAIRWLLGYVAKNDFRMFGWYRLAAGLILALLAALGVLAV
jgi:undecaprenyl-diphosphatase